MPAEWTYLNLYQNNWSPFAGQWHIHSAAEGEEIAFVPARRPWSQERREAEQSSNEVCPLIWQRLWEEADEKTAKDSNRWLRPASWRRDWHNKQVLQQSAFLWQVQYDCFYHLILHL